MTGSPKHAFTLAEVLIALALLGVIAAFSIPKILQVVGTQAKNAQAKEVMAMITDAYAAYKLQNNYGSTPPTTTVGEDLIPYMNHLGRKTTGLLDRSPNHVGPIDCALAEFVCLQLHNGAVLTLASRATTNIYSFGGNGPLNAINFNLDPDGTYSGTLLETPGSGLGIWMYYNGTLRTSGTIKPNTIRAEGIPHNPGNPVFMAEPGWFRF
jgi:prepilin-type N-terminal cleavage/methylation domain-containing protein